MQGIHAKLAVVVFALGLGACDGEVDETFEGTLESGDDLVPADNSFVDRYTFSTEEGYAISIDMTSSAFDTYLMLQSPNGEDLGQNDDIEEGVNTNSHLELVAPESGIYTINANSKTSGMTGAYQVRVTATKPTD
ncbi:MAG: hypothetical protein CMN30_15045 [Sandaracinus sp.]|nr:hypothetical protein [Sandaracinus sp.]|tara:strand:- start:245 stop:649 length:405 start_codon:yes stop_codon:yes gene_type:complete